jgi:hypothetical protein
MAEKKKDSNKLKARLPRGFADRGARRSPRRGR